VYILNLGFCFILSNAFLYYLRNSQFGSWNEEGNNHASKWLLIQALVNLKQTIYIYIYILN
jgi:hypothetical protein